MKQIIGVIEASPENGRGMPRVLGRAEYDDSVRGMNFLQARFVHDLNAADPEKGREYNRGQRHHPQGPGVMPLPVRCHNHPWAKNSEIS